MWQKLDILLNESNEKSGYAYATNVSVYIYIYIYLMNDDD